MSEKLKMKIKWVLAVLGLIFIGICLSGLIFNAFTGGSAFVTLLFLFGLIVVPVFIYVLIHFSKL